MTNGKLLFIHRSLFACLAVYILYMLVYVIMLMLNTTGYIMLLISSDNLRLSSYVSFRVTIFVVS